MTLIVGLIGGIGSGKSTVARRLASLFGGSVADADRLAHEALDDESVRRAIGARFGDHVLDEQGGVRRDALAARVFAGEDTGDLKALEAIVHPFVRRRIAALIAEEKARGTPAVILDVPLLVESPLRNDCDVIVFVRASDAARTARVAARGWTPDEIRRREARQTPLDDKERAATVVIDNDGSEEELEEALGEFHRAMTRRALGGKHG